MQIRPATEADLPVCGAIYAAAFAAPPYGEAWDSLEAPEMLGTLLARDPRSCWCLTVDGHVEGFAFCSVYGRFRATLDEFAVAPGMQGRGYGTALMSTVLREIRQMGVATIDLVAHRSSPAFRFYRKFGFRQPLSYVLMSRRLPNTDRA